jgi:hypothetical protein
MNFYRDTQERYDSDPAFRAAVTMLEQAGEAHGFTPGELKQIAFKAALNLELRAKPVLIISRPDGTKVPAEEVAGYLKDGTPVFFERTP